MLPETGLGLGVERTSFPPSRDTHLRRVSHDTDLNTNFGAIFAFWDRLFSTYRENTSITEVETGLPGYSSVAVGTIGAENGCGRGGGRQKFPDFGVPRWIGSSRSV